MIEKCGNCAFGVTEWLHQSSEMRCRKRAPIVMPGEDRWHDRTVWPKVNDDYFCGEWELKG